MSSQLNLSSLAVPQGGVNTSGIQRTTVASGSSSSMPDSLKPAYQTFMDGSYKDSFKTTGSLDYTSSPPTGQGQLPRMNSAHVRELERNLTSLLRACGNDQNRLNALHSEIKSSDKFSPGIKRDLLLSVEGKMLSARLNNRPVSMSEMFRVANNDPKLETMSLYLKTVLQQTQFTSAGGNNQVTTPFPDHPSLYEAGIKVESMKFTVSNDGGIGFKFTSFGMRGGSLEAVQGLNFERPQRLHPDAIYADTSNGWGDRGNTYLGFKPNQEVAAKWKENSENLGIASKRPDSNSESPSGIAVRKTPPSEGNERTGGIPGDSNRDGKKIDTPTTLIEKDKSGNILVSQTFDENNGTSAQKGIEGHQSTSRLVKFAGIRMGIANGSSMSVYASHTKGEDKRVVDSRSSASIAATLQTALVDNPDVKSVTITLPGGESAQVTYNKDEKQFYIGGQRLSATNEIAIGSDKKPIYFTTWNPPLHGDGTKITFNLTKGGTSSMTLESPREGRQAYTVNLGNEASKVVSDETITKLQKNTGQISAQETGLDKTLKDDSKISGIRGGQEGYIATTKEAAQIIDLQDKIQKNRV